MAGETQNYHETRDPYYVSGNFTAVAPITTSISIIPILRVPATNLAFPAGYWLKPGRRWTVYMEGKMTTAATPGNVTFELRHQTGTPTDAGGTILATSAAVAFTASKTDVAWWGRFVLEGRADPSTFVPTASPLYGTGRIFFEGSSAIVTTAANNPMWMPTTLNNATNVDMTLAGTIHVDCKRSGSTAEAITVTDLAVNALT
jgi:hypothetical protein